MIDGLLIPGRRMDQCIHTSIAFSEAKKEKENITTPSSFGIFTHGLLRDLHLFKTPVSR